MTAAARVPYRLLDAESTHGQIDAAAADNWLIQGDNLEALKALLPYYQSRYRFRKHYYGVVGELGDPPPKQSDHEFFCAVAIDEHPAVRHWVRNLPKSEFSFSLPTAAHNFYPDSSAS